MQWTRRMSPLCQASLAHVGAASSIITIWIQARINDRRERMRQAATLAMEEFKIHAGIASASGMVVEPLSIYLYHQTLVMKALDEDNYTPKRIKEIADQVFRLVDANRKIEIARVEKSKDPSKG
jgi:hypothetical protein